MNFPSKPTQSVVDSIHYDHWTIKDFKIVFLLSERILAEIKKLSRVSNWYEDVIAADTYIDRLNTCFTSIHKYYNAFGVLPQVGDRLYNEETGMIIQDRSIDGGLMTIT
ncbi:hypothetical protein, partial [Spirosoma koreense]